MRLPVSELFHTLQGEATYTGTPCLFVRLQGCPVGCPWCDTKYTWVLREDTRVEPEAILAKAEASTSWAWMDIDTLIKAKGEAHHVVITGGEPALYDLSELCAACEEHGATVQIETSGTHPLRASSKAWVTVSPKQGMPGGFGLNAETLARANEIKYPVGKMADVERLKQLLEQYQLKVQVYLQPLSCSNKATKVCIEAANAQGWRVSLQLHKYAGLR